MALVVSVGAVAVGVLASGGAALARSCDATSLQDFDVIRDPSLNHSIGRTGLGQKTILCAVTASLAGQRHAKTGRETWIGGKSGDVWREA